MARTPGYEISTGRRRAFPGDHRILVRAGFRLVYAGDRRARAPLVRRDPSGAVLARRRSSRHRRPAPELHVESLRRPARRHGTRDADEPRADAALAEPGFAAVVV